MSSSTSDVRDGVLLGYMPMGVIQMPSLGLSLLKAGVERRGVPCTVRYFNVDLLDRFFHGSGRERGRVYVRIIERYQTAFACEALFSDRRFGPDPARAAFIQAQLAAASPEERAWMRHLGEVVDPFLDDCVRSVDWSRYRILGFTSVFLGMTVPSAVLASRVKAEHPHIVTVLGGPNTEGDMGLALAERFPEFDFVLRGEADESFPALVESVLSGRDPAGIAGLARRRADSGRVEAWPAVRVENVDALPIPIFDEFIEAVGASAMAARYREHLQLPFESSRGCWWGEASHCKFCGINALGMNFRSKSRDRLLGEVEYLIDRYHPAQLAASDAILDRKYFDAVLPELARRRNGTRISYEIKANLKREQVAALADAGIDEILPGIETFSSHILKLVGKGATRLDNVLCLRLAEEHGIKVRWYHMCGLPGETLADYEGDLETIRAVPHLQPPREIARFTLQRFTPYFNNAPLNAIRGVKALAEYSAVFPFDAQTLDQLAYHFEFEHADGRAPDMSGSIETALADAIVDWQQRYGQVRLALVDDGETVMIVDTRRPAPSVFVLDGVAAVIYRLLDRPHTAEGILRASEMRAFVAGDDPLAALFSAPGPGSGGLLDRAAAEADALGAPLVSISLPVFGLSGDLTREMSSFLERLAADRLVVGENGRYLALAVPERQRPAVRAAATAARAVVYDPARRPALQTLRLMLDRAGYLRIVERMLEGSEPHMVRRIIRERRATPPPAGVGDDAWRFVSLLLLAQPLHEREARRILGPVLDPLLDLGVIAAEPPWVRCDRYALVPVAGEPFFVSRLSDEASPLESIAVYFGLDTVELIDYLDRDPGRSLLDLGCGGGLVGITAALRQAGRRVVGTEICREAIEVARLNAALHGVEYDVREGDLYHPIATEKQFDLILADPPALALPDDLAFPVYGSGGETGDHLLRRIVAEGAPHLTASGRLIAITELQCAPGAIPFVDWSRKWAADEEGRRVHIEIRGIRHLAAAYHESLGRHLQYLPGGRAAARRHASPGERLRQFAADKRLWTGYWVHVSVEAGRHEPSHHDVVWRIPDESMTAYLADLDATLQQVGLAELAPAEERP